MNLCTKVDGHGVKRKGSIQNKQHCESFRSTKTLQRTIFRDYREFLSILGTFAATGPKKLKISQDLHQNLFYKILKNTNHSVIFRALLYLERVIFIILSKERRSIHEILRVASVSNVLKM